MNQTFTGAIRQGEVLNSKLVVQQNLSGDLEADITEPELKPNAITIFSLPLELFVGAIIFISLAVAGVIIVKFGRKKNQKAVLKSPS